MGALKYTPTNLIFYVYNLIIIFSAHSSTAELQRLLQPAKPDGSVSFLVIGDWGRRGSYNQSQVALQMGEIGDKLDIDFVISTGDNFYDSGLTGLHDPAFQDSFSNIYTAPSLQKPWYTVLGNHDYRGDAEAQLSPVLKALDNRWICMRSFIVNAEIVDFLFIDTTPFVDKYFIQPNKHVYDWRGVLPRQRYLKNLLKEVDVALRESSAKWKIVIGHHTIKSAGHHRSTIELEKHLLPILHANEVDLYVNGHDHCLEHISSMESKIQFMTSGGGSKAWKGDVKNLDSDVLRFYYDGQGFMSVHISEAELSVVFYDVHGHALHHWNISYKEALYSAS